jgi:hypothetical protein
MRVRIARVRTMAFLGLSCLLPLVVVASDTCTFVPGAGVGERDVLLASFGLHPSAIGGKPWEEFSRQPSWTEQACARAVLERHVGANGARLHGEGPTLCSAVYGMYNIANDAQMDEGQQRTCYLYPSSVSRGVCEAEPSACFGVHAEASLNLGGSQLVGGVPTQLGLLNGTLEVLVLSSNLLSGTLPSELGVLTRLTTLAIDQNARISGSVPSQIGALTALNYLSMHGNQLNGALPSQLGKISAARCYLLGAQWPFPLRVDDDNRFECPLPALSTACGMNGLAFSGRDAHSPGACPTMQGLSYHPWGGDVDAAAGR